MFILGGPQQRGSVVAIFRVVCGLPTIHQWDLISVRSFYGTRW